jgi:anti-sigma28 factor (negative regulator of flagellin synthesis)
MAEPLDMWAGPDLLEQTREMRLHPDEPDEDERDPARTQRLGRLRDEIESGLYRIDVDLLAERVLDEIDRDV